MSRIMNIIKQFFKSVWLGITIAEQNRDKSPWGKF